MALRLLRAGQPLLQSGGTLSQLVAPAACGLGWQGWQQACSFSSGPQPQQEGGEQQQPPQQQQPQGGPQPQQEGEEGRPKNPAFQRYLESLGALKGSTKVQEETLGEPERPWWQQAIINAFTGWLERWVAGVIQSRVEQEFSMDEFLEGAKDAYYTVNKLISEDDFDTLKNGMLSAKLLGALEGTKRDYEQHGFSWNTTLEGDISANIRGLSFWDRDEMQSYDEERAKEAPDTLDSAQRPTGMWVVLSVQLKAKQRVKVTRLEDGTVSADLTDWRPQLWKFATGPLPSGLPVRRLDTPWFLVTI